MKDNKLSSKDSEIKEPIQPPSASVESEVTPGEIRVRFGKYGAGLTMVLGFAFQAFFNSTQSQTQRITELGILMLVGFLLGWGFARIRF